MPQDREQKTNGVVPLTFEPTQGMNTAPQRPGVSDDHAYWMDGFIPLSERRWRTMPDVSPAIYTDGTPGNIAFFYTFNIASTPYIALFRNDGSVLAYNQATSTSVTILSAGGLNPTPTVPTIGFTQYGQQYALITQQKPTSGNGYWAWDGTNLYQAGTLAPNVTLTNTGIGYATAPTISVVGGHGSGASVSASVAGGVVVNVSVINPGFGYIAGDLPSLMFSGGIVTPSGASVSVVSMGSVAGGTGGTVTPFWNILQGTTKFTPTLSLIAAGANYTSLATASFTSPVGGGSWVSNGTPSITLGISGGAFASATLEPAPNNASMAFTPATDVINATTIASAAGTSLISFGVGGASVSPGALVFDQTNSSVIPLNTSIINGLPNGQSTATLSQVILAPGVGLGDLMNFVPPNNFPGVATPDNGYFFVNNVTVVAGGANYNNNTSIVVAGGSPFKSATVTPALSGAALGSLVTINIVDGGEYFSNAKPTLTVTDSTTTAAATVSIWPFGVMGNAVQTYQSSVWVFNGNAYQFTGPGLLSNFATSVGGGSRQSNSNYLKVGFTNAISSNGFLFLIGDSSMDYISGVNTTGTPPTTTFTQNNSDPEIGTPYAAAIDTWGTDIMLANALGVFLSSGGEFRKVSTQLDGVYQTRPAGSQQAFFANPFSGAQLSVAKAVVFGKRLWVVLVPIVDLITGSNVNKLFIIRDKKIWSASNQSVAFTFINTYDFQGVINAYGTDGTSIYALFQVPGGGFTKTLQSKLWDEPGGMEFNKATSRFWSTWFANSTVSTSISLTVDSVGLSSAGQLTSSSGYSIAGPTSVGYYVTNPQGVGQMGVFTGMTLKTNAADMELITAKIADEVVGEMT